MTVRELVEFLQNQPQEIQVAFTCCSEQRILEAGEIELIDGCIPRPDGWVQNKRPDMNTQKYLLFPGN